MNAPSQSSNALVPPKRLPVLRADSDFLPAAIEILETPPSPNRMAFLVAICAFAVVALVWSYFGRLDIIASARGKVQPTGRVRVVQPVETGKVVQILSHDGQDVKAGDPLVKLDDADVLSDQASALAAWNSFRAERLRRLAVLAAASTPDFKITPIAWPDYIPADIRSREDRVLAGDIGQLSAAVASYDAQINQKQAEQKRLADTAASQKNLLDVLQQRVDMRAALVKNGAGPLTNLIDARENLNYHTANYTTMVGQISESKAGEEVLRRDRAKTIDTFIADNRQKLADAERQIDEYQQKLAKAVAHLSHMTLLAPIDGHVAASTVTSIGQVVTVGEEVMRVVPDGAGLEIQAYLENKDIGFVKPGQQAAVKIEAFPFTRYGTLSATVKRVSLDAIPDLDAQQMEGDPAKSNKTSGFAGAQRTQNLYFPVTLVPDGRSMEVDGSTVAITPGMAVNIEIKTGTRRILEFVFSPLVETASKAMRDR